MVKELQYTSINRILDEIHDHPMLHSVTLEQAVRYTLTFMAKHGYPKFYQDKIDNIEINDFRGLLPCDLVSIIQVKDLDTDVCLRAMTDNFTPGLIPTPPTSSPTSADALQPGELYIPPMKRYLDEPAFKTQGRVIYTSFPKGMVQIAYKSIPVDENGFPLLFDNEMYIEALKAFIKMKVFTIKFDKGDITAGILQNAKQDYAFASGQLAAEFTIPSVSEMESLTRMFNTLIPRTRHFDNGFKNMGDREYIRRH